MIPAAPLELADWRRRVFGIYRSVRAGDDPHASWRLWRTEKDELFRNHSQSPIPLEDRGAFAGLSYFDYDPRARTVALVEPVYPEPELIDSSGAGGAGMQAVLVARACFELYGQSQTLGLYWFDNYGGGLFLSFRDATSGASTYGGCRYLLDTVKGADLGGEAGGLVLDFNFAYHPSCAYDPGWNCPLAPVNNRLNLAVEAGERWNKE
ncbi:MAG: DUF1684 domain-containing protein [Actinomycetota bacterium]